MNSYSNDTSLVEFWNSDVSLVNFTARKSAMITDTHKSDVSFMDSNATTDECHFKSINLEFGANKSCFLVTKNTDILDNSLFILHGHPAFILFKDSIVRVDVACSDTPNTGENPFTTLRLESSVMYLQEPLPVINKLLAWKSVIWSANVSLNTSESNFIDIAKTNGVFNFSQCNKKQPNSQAMVDFSETIYAGGGNYFCVFVLLLDWINLNSSLCHIIFFFLL